MADVAMQDAEEEFSVSDWACPICLELLHKPSVNSVCGHLYCSWCMHRSMNPYVASKCPLCRRAYAHLTAVCSQLDGFLQRTFPLEYEKRAIETQEECWWQEADGTGEADVDGEPLFRAQLVDITMEVQEAGEHPEGRVSVRLAAKPWPSHSIAHFSCSAPGCGRLLHQPRVLFCGHALCSACCRTTASLASSPSSSVRGNRGAGSGSGRGKAHVRCPTCRVVTLVPPAVCMALDGLTRRLFPTEYEEQEIEEQQQRGLGRQQQGEGEEGECGKGCSRPMGWQQAGVAQVVVEEEEEADGEYSQGLVLMRDDEDVTEDEEEEGEQEREQHQLAWQEAGGHGTGLAHQRQQQQAAAPHLGSSGDALVAEPGVEAGPWRRGTHGPDAAGNGAEEIQHRGEEEEEEAEGEVESGGFHTGSERMQTSDDDNDIEGVEYVDAHEELQQQGGDDAGPEAAAPGSAGGVGSAGDSSGASRAGGDGSAGDGSGASRDAPPVRRSRRREGRSSAAAADGGHVVRLKLDKERFVHHAAGCDSCGLYPIVGRRYRCLECRSAMGYDLCGTCFEAGLHHKGKFHSQHKQGHRMEEVVPRPNSIHVLKSLHPELSMDQFLPLLSMMYEGVGGGAFGLEEEARRPMMHARDGAHAGGAHASGRGRPRERGNGGGGGDGEAALRRPLEASQERRQRRRRAGEAGGTGAGAEAAAGDNPPSADGGAGGNGGNADVPTPAAWPPLRQGVGAAAAAEQVDEEEEGVGGVVQERHRRQAREGGGQMEERGAEEREEGVGDRGGGALPAAPEEREEEEEVRDGIGGGSREAAVLEGAAPAAAVGLPLRGGSAGPGGYAHHGPRPSEWGPVPGDRRA